MAKKQTTRRTQDAWVEQDLVISRALVAIFADESLAERLAFRGGTALYKLYVTLAVRYSAGISKNAIAER